MNTKRTTFHSFPRINKTTILRRTEFWRWLERSPKAYKQAFSETLICYLYQFGYRFYEHVLTNGQVHNHKAVYDCYRATYYY